VKGKGANITLEREGRVEGIKILENKNNLAIWKSEIFFYKYGQIEKLLKF
jgi:hypothetical protein